MNTKVEFENITIDYSDLTYQSEHNGEAEFYFPIDLLRQAAEYISDQWDMEKENRHFSDYMRSSIVDLYQEALDSGEDSIFMTDVDQAICLLEYAMTQRSKEFYNVVAHYSNIIWLFHDLSHVRHDFHDFEAGVTEGGEVQAIKYSINKLIEYCIPVPYHILSKTDEEFRNRFNSFTHDFTGLAESLEAAARQTPKVLIA